MFAPSATVAQAEQVCREFVVQFPTPNAARALELAEAGRLSWFQVEGLFARSLREALCEAQAS